MFTFFVSIICLVVFVIKSKFRTKRYILGAVLGILVSFILIGVTAPSDSKVDEEQKTKEEQLLKQEKASSKKEKAAKKVAAEKAAAEKEAAQAAEKEAAAQAAAQAAAEQAAAQAATQGNGSSNGITGYCKDGTVASGDPSARGRANSCYGHGGWVR